MLDATKKTCSYCLRAMSVSGTAPVRHGFAVNNTGHGANGLQGAWHGGPCKGVSYPHLGLSTEGLEAAIADAAAHLERCVAARVALDARPVLTYGKRDYNRKGHPVVATVEVQPGAMSPAPGPGVIQHPEYETLLASAIRRADADVDYAGRDLPILQGALARWTPEA